MPHYRYRITKKEEKNREHFKAEVRRWLESVGAVPDSFYAYRLETTLGTLLVSPHDTWVACRWEDVGRAVARIGANAMNRFSGKWNFHYDSSNFQSRHLADTAVAHFTAEVSRFLPNKEQP